MEKRSSARRYGSPLSIGSYSTGGEKLGGFSDPGFVGTAIGVLLLDGLVDRFLDGERLHRVLDRRAECARVVADTRALETLETLETLEQRQARWGSCRRIIIVGGMGDAEFRLLSRLGHDAPPFTSTAEPLPPLPIYPTLLRANHLLSICPLTDSPPHSERDSVDHRPKAPCIC